MARDTRFEAPRGVASAGTAFTIAFDNQDGVPHNVAIVDPSGRAVFTGDIVTGRSVSYRISALAAGSYTFRCDVHPGMTGSLIVN